MNILILEDFSGLGRLLKHSLCQVGCDVTLVATTDTVPVGLPADILIRSKFSGVLGKIFRRLKLIQFLLTMQRYDACLISNQSIIFQGVARLALGFLRKKCSRRYLLVCGLDSVLVRPEIYMNIPGIQPIQSLNKKFLDKHRSSFQQKILAEVMLVCDAVIPISKAFQIGWMRSEYANKVTDPIPIPFQVDYVRQLKKEVGKKSRSESIEFLHFETRDEKGTSSIVNNFELLTKERDVKLSLCVRGRVGFKRFVELLDECDVFVDRCTGSYYGSITTLVALSLGKITLTAHIELENAELDGWPPIIPLGENYDDLSTAVEAALENLRLSPRAYEERCIQFVQRHHDPVIIGARYIGLIGSQYG